MATAAYTGKIYVKATSGAPSSGDELESVTDASFEKMRTVLETTRIGGDGWKRRILGLKDFNGSLTCDEDPAAAEQILLVDAEEDGTTVYVTDLPDGTNGFTYPVLVEKLSRKGAVDGKNEITFSLQCNGAPVAVP